jgi:asparagine synthase (glutamine-hydrolysing)
MCGIFGLLSLKGALDSEKFKIPNDTDILKHRGPDDFGSFMDKSVYLGFRRLSIIDLVTGSQPLFNEDCSKCIIFNGEIYNFQELRRSLEASGHRFATNSDTETIVHAYEEWGPRCLDRFRGMFAFAIWDKKEQSLFIARDRMGIKPLFYSIVDGVLYFASEMKALLQFPNFPREIDPDGVASFFSLSYIPAPYTIYKQIRKLLPGHYMMVKEGGIKTYQYWDLQFNPDYSSSEKQFSDQFMGILGEAVKLRMIADVPLGAFLSGGIDSGAIVALMSRQSVDPVRTFCIGFGGNTGGHLDERGYAREVGQKYGCMHSEFEVMPDIQAIAEEIVTSFDEPFADPGAIPSYYVCKIARQHVTVALSGLGGDEVFAGYERYLGFRIGSLYSRLPGFLRASIIRPLIESLPERSDGHYTVNHLKRFVRSSHLPDDQRYFGSLSRLQHADKGFLFNDPNLKQGLDNCRELVLSHFKAPNATEPMDRVFYCDFKTYLPDDILALTDRISMWHALEVRVPFLDHKFVEFCATIPHCMKINLWDKKRILKKALRGILPGSVINHRKQGFIGPMSQWLRADLKDYVFQTLSAKRLDQHGILNKEAVRTIIDEHFSRKEIHDKLIWSMIMFQKWYDAYILNHYPLRSRR